MTKRSSCINDRVKDHKIEEEKKEANQEMPFAPLITTPKSTVSDSSSPPAIESPTNKKRIIFLRILLWCIHGTLFALFVPYVASVCLHQITLDYLQPQLELMKWESAGRDYDELTYYHRECDASDISAKSLDDLLIGPNTTTKEATQHMFRHGVSMYPNLLTPETAASLRQFIDNENRRQEGWSVIENENRYSWGIDMNMHPALQTYWKELASNRQLVQALQSIVGPDPAIIEFTAITSAYGAVDQHDHQDVVPKGSGAKFARSFIQSYSLFIPLQDTTYDMGATHVCPGTHLCSNGCELHCPPNNLAMSGDSVWPTGWGALINQQTTHKGMGHFCKDCLDRIVLIASFASRPQTKRKLETRMIGLGGSYSLKWNHWGNTFSDFVHADTKMTELQKYLRSLGLLQGNGWTWVSQASMRISNFEAGFNEAQDFVEDGGVSFLPKSWQALDVLEDFESDDDDEDDSSEDNPWYIYLFQTLNIVEGKLKQLNTLAVGGFLALSLLVHLVVPGKKSILFGSITTLLVSHGMTCLAFWMALQAVNKSNWARDIKSGKAYRLQSINNFENVRIAAMTIPTKDDILISRHYFTDMLAGYSGVVDAAHPGNREWKSLVQQMSVGYPNLSDTLKKDLCESMVRWMKHSSRRFLRPNIYRQWERIVEETELVEMCNIQATSASNDLMSNMLREINILKDDARNGRWRDMVIHTNVIPKYLDTWEERFLPISIPKEETPRPAFSSWQLSSRASLRPPVTAEPETTKRRPLPPTSKLEEPFSGAWFEVGDDVEASYRCQGREWYRGTIVAAISNHASYTVRYDDGDIDESLHFFCIRRLHAYEVGEEVDFRTEVGGQWMAGTIVEIEDDESVSVKDYSSGFVFDDLSPSLLRQLARPVGLRVIARYKGGNEYFPGIIVEDNGDGTYNVQYDDGDYEDSVQKDMII